MRDIALVRLPAVTDMATGEGGVNAVVSVRSGGRRNVYVHVIEGIVPWHDRCGRLLFP